jgi:hypothetical protein
MGSEIEQKLVPYNGAGVCRHALAAAVFQEVPSECRSRRCEVSVWSGGGLDWDVPTRLFQKGWFKPTVLHRALQFSELGEMRVAEGAIG